MRKGFKHTEETKRKLSEACKGKICSEEQRKNQSIVMKGKYTGQNNSMFGKKHTKKTRRKMSESHRGRTFSEETRKKISIAKKGKTHSEKHKKALSKARKGRSGDKSPNWKGGISFFPYPSIFNNKLKQFIKNRDNNECQNPFCSGGYRTLTIHHIDFDKNNCSQFNLITLCNSCNVKANNQYRWKRLYKKILWSKYV